MTAPNLCAWRPLAFVAFHKAVLWADTMRHLMLSGWTMREARLFMARVERQ